MTQDGCSFLLLWLQLLQLLSVLLCILYPDLRKTLPLLLFTTDSLLKLNQCCVFTSVCKMNNDVFMLNNRLYNPITTYFPSHMCESRKKHHIKGKNVNPHAQTDVHG